MALEIFGRLPTVPEYFKAYINHNVNLAEEPKQCCPFHHENTPSFSYDGRTGRWSCFGSCHAHGDVVDMHRRWFKIGSREEAEMDLNRICKIKKDSFISKKEDSIISRQHIETKAAYLTANIMANTRERWIELDEVMTKYPPSEEELYELTLNWSNLV